MGSDGGVLVIACGALAREIKTLRELNGWSHMTLQCLPAELHNRPEKIPAAVQAQIQAARGRFHSIFVAYGDCGTGGLLDAMLQVEQVERLPGAHCYEFYAGHAEFERLAEREVGTFYLTDFLLLHFERLVVRGLGLDQHPELRDMYFGNYRRLVYLAQRATPERVAQAAQAAQQLGLQFEWQHTGYGELEGALARIQLQDKAAPTGAH